MISKPAKWIIHKLVRKGRWGHNVIRERNIPRRNAPKKETREALKELLEAGYLIQKSGLGERTYSLNAHKKREIMEIYDSFSKLE